jgi:hypothetical protein
VVLEENMRQSLAFGASILALLYATNASAGVVVNSTQIKLDTKQASQMTISVESDRLKVVSPEATVIYRGDLNRLWIVNAARQTYMEMTPETIQRMSSQMAGMQAQLGAAQAQLQAQLAQMPPEQRAMMQQMLAGRGLGGPAAAPAGPPQIAYAKAGGSKTVAGFNCDLYRMTSNGQPEQDLCIAPLGSAGLGPADFQVMEKFAAFVAPLASSPMAPKNAYMNWNEMNRAIGFAGVPLDTIIYVQGRPSIEQGVTKIDRKAVSAAEFELPAGLTKQDMPMGPPGR